MARRRTPARATASTAWSRCSASCRARRSSRRRSRPTCSPSRLRGLLARATSTRCAPPAMSCGSAPDRSAPRRPRPPVLPRPGAACCCRPTDPDEPPRGRIHDAVREHLGAAGRVLLVRPARRRRPTPPTPSCSAALWDLVWAGEVTNDSLAPLRVVARRASRSAPRRRPQPPTTRAGSRGSGRPQARAAGRSSPPLAEPPASSPTEAAHAAALQLLERNGVLTREAALAEGVEGGFAGVYPVLKALEERGPGAAGLLRRRAGRGPVRLARRRRSAARPPRARARRREAVVLAATDPAQPYGAVAAVARIRRAARPAPRARWWCWSRARRSRTSTAVGARLRHLPGAQPATTCGSTALAGIVKDGRVRSLELHRIDGEPALHVAVAPDAARRRLRRRLSRSRPPVVTPPLCAAAIHPSSPLICCPEGDGSEPPGLHAPDA